MSNWTPKVSVRKKKQSTIIDDGEKKENNNLFHSFDFAGGVKLLIPKTGKATDAIMDGELKQIKVELKSFSDKYCREEELPESNNK